MVNRIYTFLGLAMKAGKVLSGDETCERALLSGKVFLMIISADASENTRDKFSGMCRYRNTDIRFFGEKEMLGKAIGKGIRSVVAVMDKSFAGRLTELIDGSGIEHGGV